MDLSNTYPDTLEDVGDCVESGLFKIFYASKFLHIDEFTKQEYADNVILEYVPGFESVTQIPCGCIGYHESNQWLFKLATMKFIMQYNIIPISYTNLNSLMNIKRTSGKIQKAYFSQNNCIHMSKSYNKLVANCSFDDPETELEPTNFSEKTKYVLIENLLEINELNNLIITYKVYSDEYISTLDAFKQECFNHYNKLMHDWFKTFEENLDETIDITINVAHFNDNDIDIE